MTTSDDDTRPASPAIDPRCLSAQDLAAWGIEDYAYVRPVVAYGVEAYGVFAADGTMLGVLGSRETARAAVLQHDLVPLSVH